ncbi:hypothetical protein ACHQM5_003917 [Ranunculus cassubicifolius]
MSSPSFSLPFILFSLFVTLSTVAQAAVPSSKTFKYVLQGEFGQYITEYYASYRMIIIPNFETASMPFQLFFYNTTPNAYTLGLRLGRARYESHLVPMEIWYLQMTDTKNKGVVDIQLLPTRNLVLMDKNRRFVWQSFDYPGDTLLMGAGLRPGGVNKLVSRVSDADGSEGPYSLVLEKDRVALYLKSKNSPKPLLYYAKVLQLSPINRVVYKVEPLSENAFEYEIAFEVFVGNSSYSQRIGRPTKFNSTLSLLRVGSDGSLKVYSFYDRVELGGWEVTYSEFDRDDIYGGTECRLPTRCGSLGVCEDDQCVACPTPKGILPSCKGGSQVVDYYKVVGVEHFTYEYTQGDGPTKLADCRAKCSMDCGCLGFFYREESSKSLLAPVLGTLTKVTNKSHVAYIKMSK